METLCAGELSGLFYYKYRVYTGFGTFDLMRREHDFSECYVNADSKKGDFQLLVYEKRKCLPEWLYGGVMYQIFPDRFFSAGNCPAKDDAVLCRDRETFPSYFRDRLENEKNNVFYGGDLAGIVEKLDYLASLGVTCLYLNPVFESPSNHRYDTADYLHVDRMLGGDEALLSLVRAASEQGIAILLDGVFNHTGADSVYFNAKGTYASVGAAQSKVSPYYPWYTFEHYPDRYDAWWGVKTLPRVNSDEPSYREFLFGEDGVVRRYMKFGIAGWRIDVADELSDDFLTQLSDVVTEEKPDAAILGEVWEDASHKVAYGQMRSYVLGDTLDSVMNYPLRDALIAFLMAQKDAAAVAKELSSLAQNYPKPFLYALMNLMGSHDRPRILNVLAGNDGSDIPRSQRADHRLSREERMIGALREQLMLRFMFSVPGMPCIYYGDEAGVEGCADPFCRRTYPWGREDQDMLTRYKAMAAMRNGHPVLKTGECAYIAPCSAVLGVIRKNENGKDAFGKKAENACAVTLINRSAREVVVYLTSADVSGAQTLVSDDGQIFTARSGAFSVKIKGLQGMTMFAM